MKHINESIEYNIMYITDTKLNTTKRTFPIPIILHIINTLPTEHMWTSIKYNRSLITSSTRT